MKYIFFSIILFLSIYGFKDVNAQPPPFDPWAVNVNTPADLTLFSDQLEELVPLLDTLQRQSRCPEEENICAGGWTAWRFDTAIAIHPSYPNCPILINYRHRVCTSNGLLIEHEIFGFVVRNDLPGCTGLSAYLSSGSTSDQADKANQLEHDIYGLMAKQRFLELQNTLLNLPPAQRDTLFCSDPQGQHIRIAYTKGQCRGFCVGYFSSPAGWYATSYKPKNCGNDACCRVENSFCVDDVTGQLVHTETVTASTQQLAECFAYPMTNTDCFNEVLAGGWINPGLHTLESAWVINCRQTCDLNFLNLGGQQIIEGQ